MATNPAMRRSIEGWIEAMDAWRRDLGASGQHPVLDRLRLPARHGSARPRARARGRRSARPAATRRSCGTSGIARSRHRPPTGFLRDLVVERKGEHVGRLDVKHGGITIIGNIARLEGVKAGIPAKETLDRLAGAAAAGTLDAIDGERAVGGVPVPVGGAAAASGATGAERRAPGRLRRPVDARAGDQARAQGGVRRDRSDAARAGGRARPAHAIAGERRRLRAGRRSPSRGSRRPRGSSRR